MSPFTNGFLNMKELFATLTADKITRSSMAVAMTFFILTLGFIVLTYSKLPPVIPLFNQLPWGVERLGNRLSIFLPLIVGILCSFTNLLLASITYNTMPLVARILSVTSFLIALLCLIFSVRTILLIT